jgi:hypothetical protein
LSVEKYSTDTGEVTIDIVPRAKGCEVTLTHTMKATHAPFRDRTEDGWRNILDVAAQLLVDEAPTCGIGVAQHAAIPAQIGVMFEHLATTLDVHRRMLVLDDANARKEDEVYRALAASWKEIASLVQKATAEMAAQRDLPMGAHDETAWGDDHLSAFEKFVNAQTQVLALLRVAAERDQEMLAAMKKPA